MVSFPFSPSLPASTISERQELVATNRGGVRFSATLAPAFSAAKECLFDHSLRKLESGGHTEIVHAKQTRLRPLKHTRYAAMFRRRRVTIAVGVLAGNSIVLAADTEHTYEGGEIKGNDTKIIGGESRDQDGRLLSAVGIVGAGYTDYVNSFRMPLLHYLMNDVGRGPIFDQTAVQHEIETRLKGFYERHVMPFLPYDRSVEFDLLIGVCLRGVRMLVASNKTAVREVVGAECIGVGRSYGTGIINNFPLNGDVATAVMQACYTVQLVKDTVKDCGRSTQIICLTQHGTVYIPDGIIQELEAIVMHHSQWRTLLLQHLFSGFEIDMSLNGEKKTFARLRQSINDTISAIDHK